MGNVLKLDKFRNDRRKAYFKKFSVHLDKAISGVLSFHYTEDLAHLTRMYQEYCSSQNAMAWDFEEFRDVLYTLVAQTISESIIERVKNEYWYDSVYVTSDYVTERALSMIVLGDMIQAAIK